MKTAQEIIEAVLALGYTQAGFLPKEKRVLMPEVIGMCEKNTCRRYGSNWACPPANGTLEECEKRLAGYENMLLYSKKYDLEDSLDYEAMIDGAKHFRQMADGLHELAAKELGSFLILTNGGCGRCEKCAYPAPCRFPGKLHPSLEGMGFMVSSIAKDAGINYINGKNTITYFGALLW